jgi:hypothetical protein
MQAFYIFSVFGDASRGVALTTMKKKKKKKKTLSFELTKTKYAFYKHLKAYTHFLKVYGK